MATVRIVAKDNASGDRVILYMGDDHHQAAALVQGILVAGGRNSLGMEIEWGEQQQPPAGRSAPPRRQEEEEEQPPPRQDDAEGRKPQESGATRPVRRGDPKRQ